MYKFNMLDLIDEFLRENDIPLDKFKFDGKILDEFFRLSITNKIRKCAANCGDDTTYYDDANYYLRRDKNGKLCLIAERKKAITKDGTVTPNNGKGDTYKVVVCSGSGNKAEFDDEGEYHTYSQRDVLFGAAVFKYVQAKRKEIRKELEQKPDYQSLLPLDKKKREIREVEKATRAVFADFGSDLESMYLQSNYQGECNGSIKRLKNALDRYYLRNGIFYKTPEPKSIKDNDAVKDGSSYSPKAERANAEIPLSKRTEILEKYEPLYQSPCYTESIADYNYLCYLYELNAGSYAIVFEPRYCNAFTKVYIVEDTFGYMTEEKFRNLARSYLERDYASDLNDNHSFRSRHTTLKNFEGFLRCVFDGGRDAESINASLARFRHLPVNGRKRKGRG